MSEDERPEVMSADEEQADEVTETSAELPEPDDSPETLDALLLEAEVAEVVEYESPEGAEAPEDVASEPEAESPPGPEVEALGEVPAVTAADVPALAGCDIDESWEGQEPCVTDVAEEPEAGTIEEPNPADTAPPLTEEEALKQVRAAYAAPTWPFAIYVGMWIALAVLAGYQLMQVPANTPLTETRVYAMTLLGGVVLTIAGPVLVLAVWLGTRLRRRESVATGLFASALLKGSIATLIGVLIWWATLFALDQLRFGRML